MTNKTGLLAGLAIAATAFICGIGGCLGATIFRPASGAASAGGAPSVANVKPVTVEVEVTREIEVTREVEVTRIVEGASTATSASVIDPEQFKSELSQAIATDVESLDDVEVVTLSRFEQSVLNLELKTLWASEDNQADVSYKVILLLASELTDFDRAELERLLGGPMTFRLTTYSTDGNYRYQSETDFDTLLKVANRSISYEEWAAAANAGFR